MDDLNKYTEEDILQAVALHLMIVSKTEVQLTEETKNDPYIQYYLEKLRELFDVMQDDFKKVAETKNENDGKNLKFVMGDDGLTEV